MHDHMVEQRQARFELAPYPARKILAGRILQTRHLVEIAVIELVEQRRERGTEIGEIHDPAELGVQWSAHVHLDAERMSVQTRAFVPRRHIRKSMRGFDPEGFGNIHPTILSGAGGTA